MSQRPTHAPAVVRELLNREKKVDSTHFPELIQSYSALVNGVINSLLPEHPEVAPKLAAGVFEAFAIRSRRLSAKTCLATWFFRSAFFAAARERKRLKLATPKKKSPLKAQFRTLKKISRIKRKY